MSRQSLVSHRLTARCITAAATTLLVTATAIALGALTQPLGAQTESVLAKDARVRIVIPATGARHEQRLAGTLLRLRGDTAVLSTGWARSDTAAFRIGDPAGARLEHLVVNRSSRTGGAILGVIIGGGVAGTIMGKLTKDCGFDCMGEFYMGFILGAILGGVAGERIATTKRWQPVTSTGVRIALAPRAIGVGVTF